MMKPLLPLWLNRRKKRYKHSTPLVLIPGAFAVFSFCRIRQASGKGRRVRKRPGWREVCGRAGGKGALMEPIQSKDNSRVKEYAKLASSRKYREETGRFVLEGDKLFTEALRSGVEVEQVLVTPAFRDAHPELEEPLRGLTAFEVSGAAEGRLSLSKTPQGLYAVCKKLDKPENLAKIDCNGSYIGLWDLQDPGNVGTILRGADAMRLSGVILSENCCDLYNLKTIRAAMGSLFRVPVWTVDMAAFLRESGLRSYAAVVDPSAPSVETVDFRGSVAVIGNEGNGLSDGQAAACSGRITIPMRGNAESLNAAMAATVLMWEMARKGDV